MVDPARLPRAGSGSVLVGGGRSVPSISSEIPYDAAIDCDAGRAISGWLSTGEHAEDDE
jgi:hypothetical protein